MEAGTLVQLMTETDEGELLVHETRIERGLREFKNVGMSLAAIRDKRLYRGQYATFEDYCRERWGIQRAHAYRLIEGARVVENLSPIGDKLPVTESQVRPLAKLEPDVQREVWQQAVATAPEGKVTAKHIEQTVVQYAKGNKDGVTPAKSSTPLVDEDGDTPKTVTLRVARVVYLMTLGKWMTLEEIAGITGLSVNGAWRLMDRLAGGHHVPVTDDENGRWGILGVDSEDLPY